MIACRFLLDATGRNALVARRLGAKRHVYDRLCGIAAIVPRGRDSEDVLAVMSARYGWWYTTPAGADHMLACLMSDTDILIALRAHRPSTWKRLMLQADLVPPLPARATAEVTLQSMPCETAVTWPVGGDGWLAVGDAAATFDPLASAGILKALMDGRRAATIAAAALGQPNELDRDTYAAALRDNVVSYLAMRRAQYRTETRFRHDAFWRRRTA